MCHTGSKHVYSNQQMNRSPCSNSDGKAKLSFTCSIYASLTIYFLLITYSCQHHTFEKQTASPRILKNSTHPSFTTLYKLLSINRHTGLRKKVFLSQSVQTGTVSLPGSYCSNGKNFQHFTKKNVPRHYSGMTQIHNKTQAATKAHTQLVLSVCVISKL